MSIALSAVIAPSRLLRRVLAGYALCCCAAAVLLCGPQAARFHAPRASAALTAVAALLAWRARPSTVRRIDISGPGAPPLLVQHSMGSAWSVPAPQQVLACTAWPALLLLVVRAADGGPVVLLAILPDCVPAGQFRNIAVAIRTLARRDGSLRKYKIL